MSKLNLKTDKADNGDSGEPLLEFELSADAIASGERRGTSFKVNTVLHRLVKAAAALQDRQQDDILNEAIRDVLLKYGHLKLRP